MASTLACVGLAVGSAEELAAAMDDLEVEDHGRAGGLRLLRHVDPGGTRIVTAVDDGDVVDLVPSVEAPLGALLGDLRRQDGDGAPVAADVLDPESGEVVTRLLCDLEQARCLPAPRDAAAIPAGVQWPASVVALGVEVVVHADEAAFASTGSDFAAESFLSYGFFRSGDDDGDGSTEPTAWLAGTVLEAETRTTEATGDQVHAVRVRTVGFTATVCLAASEHPERPEPGNVVAGTCWLVVDVPSLWNVDIGSLNDLAPRRRKRRWFSRPLPGDAPA